LTELDVVQVRSTWLPWQPISY